MDKDISVWIALELLGLGLVDGPGVADRLVAQQAPGLAHAHLGGHAGLAGLGQVAGGHQIGVGVLDRKYPDDEGRR